MRKLRESPSFEHSQSPQSSPLDRHFPSAAGESGLSQVGVTARNVRVGFCLIKDLFTIT